MSCKNCEHFKKAEKYSGGKCNRYPPQVLYWVNPVSGNSDFVNETPWVTEEHHCGEFKDVD